MHPRFQNRSGLFSDFKLHWVLSFLLHHDGPCVGHSLGVASQVESGAQAERVNHRRAHDGNMAKAD